MDDVAPDLWGEMGGGLITAICLCSFYWFVSRPISGSVCLSLCISILLTYYILISLFIYRSTCLAIYLSVLLYMYTSFMYYCIYLSICPSIDISTLFVFLLSLIITASTELLLKLENIITMFLLFKGFIPLAITRRNAYYRYVTI